MKLDIASGVVATSHNFASTQCTIDAEDMRYISELLRNNYSNTVLATIREIYCNAVDANLDCGKTPESIIVNVPSQLNQNFSVRDFGTGLTHDQVFNLYTKIGKSTKRDSNAKIGSFGIGRLAPLSYNKDGFTITSFVNGEKRVYYMYISEENDTKIDELFVGPTDEQNGMLISVAVNSSDVYSFRSTCCSFFQYFDILPQFVGIDAKEINQQTNEVVLSGENWKIYSRGAGSCVIMGGVGYPLNLSLCKLDESCSWLKNIHLSLKIPIGSVKLHHSRENLEYNQKTQMFLLGEAQKIAVQVRTKIEEDFSQKITCLKEAKIHYKNLRMTFPYNIFQALDSGGVFNYKGVRLSEEFGERYCDVNGNSHTRIPFVARSFYLSNDKIRSNRAYTVAAVEKSAYVFNDNTDASKKLNNRLRSLFDRYDNVYYIDHDNSSTPRNVLDGVETFKKKNRFDLVTKDVFNLSDLQEVKAPKSVQTTRASYNAEFFFHLMSSGLKKADEKEIEDNNIVKPYLKVKNRKFIGDEGILANNLSYSRLNGIFAACEEAFQTKVYAVSVMAAESKKFAGYTDFVPFSKFIQEKWNELDQEHKEMFFKHVQIASDTSASGESVALRSLMSAGIKIPLAQKYFDEVAQIKKDIVSFKLSCIFQFFCSAHSLKEVLKLDFGAPKQPLLPNFNSIAVQVFERYPLLNYINNYDYESISEKIQTYVNLVDQVNP